MNRLFLFFRNLSLTLIAVVVCALIAYVLSFALGACFYHEAFAYRVGNVSSIETAKLTDYDHMRFCVVMFGGGAGVLLAQSVFLVEQLGVDTIAKA